jgi:uncharacterized protein
MSARKSFLSPKVTLSRSRIGYGLFAISLILKDQLVVDYHKGPGKFLTTSEANQLYRKGNDYMIQIDFDRFFAATSETELEDVDFINHSCDPNVGFKGKLKLIAMRDIFPGEEITFDYAMSESSDFEMYCKCGSPLCRRKVTGEDWKRTDLQERYSNFFSEYLKRKLN